MRVYVPNRQRIAVREAGAFERTRAVHGSRLFPEHLARMADRLVMTYRPSMGRELERAGCLSGAGALWSQWHGYLEQKSGRALRTWLDESGIPLEEAHTSGHASVSDLQRLAAALSPARVVPIHTTAPERFSSLVENAEVRRDGEWWEV